MSLFKNFGTGFSAYGKAINMLFTKQLWWFLLFPVLLNIVFFVDAGIGNGLKTKLSEALSLQNFKLAKSYISTAYIAIFLISALVFCIGVAFIFLVDLQTLFNTSTLESELKTVLLVTLFLVITSFVLNLYKSFYYANQQASKVELAMLLYQASILISTAILLHFFPRKLLFVALFYGCLNILVGCVFTFLFFKKNKKIKPSFTAFSKEKVKDLMGLSLAFFGIQLCMIIIFTTDNLIISKLLGPSEVTNYDIVYKLFQVTITISVIAQDPFWALYTDAFQKKDFSWIKKTIIRLNKLFIAFIFVITGLFFVSKHIIKIWIQRDLEIATNLILFMSIFVLIRVYGTIYMTFLNSVGKVKLQFWLYFFGAIINIPLSIYLVKTFDLGSSGVILGTVFSILSLSLILPIQTFKILKKNEAN